MDTLQVRVESVGSAWRFMGATISGVISRVTTVITHTRGFITLLITTHFHLQEEQRKGL